VQYNTYLLYQEGEIMRVLTVSNEKGGVGKTTITVNTAAALAERGQRVIVIDLDTQAQASFWLGVDPKKVPGDRSAGTVITGAVPLVDTLLETHTQNIYLCAAHPTLAEAARELAERPDGVHLLDDMLQQAEVDAPQLQDAYVLIDCPPSRATLVVFSALAAAQYIIAPMLTEAMSVSGLGELQETVHRLRRRVAPNLPDPRVVLNNVQPPSRSSRADKDILADLQEALSNRLFATRISRNAPLRECYAAQRTIMQFDPSSLAARQFRELAGEIEALFH
jgi:chromosome partitioning protein